MEKLSPEELKQYYGDPVEETVPFEYLSEKKSHNSITKSGALGGGVPTEKVKFALLDYVHDPFQNKSDIADRWDIDRDSFIRAIKLYQPWLQKEADRLWREKRPLAMRKMEELAIDDKNFKALEFILRAQGINPAKPEDSQDINVTVTLPEKSQIEFSKRVEQEELENEYFNDEVNEDDGC